jgi:hypothetical protein
MIFATLMEVKTEVSQTAERSSNEELQEVTTETFVQRHNGSPVGKTPGSK